MNAYELAWAIYGHPMVRAVVGLLLANVLVGIATSLYRGDFHLAETADFLRTRAVPYLLGAGTIQLVLTTVLPEWSGLSGAAGTAVWMFVMAALVGHILGQLRDMGLPIPAMLGRAPAAPESPDPPPRDAVRLTEKIRALGLRDTEALVDREMALRESGWEGRAGFNDPAEGGRPA